MEYPASRVGVSKGNARRSGAAQGGLGPTAPLLVVTGQAGEVRRTDYGLMDCAGELCAGAGQRPRWVSIRFLRKQVEFYRERQVNRWRASDPMRVALVLRARRFPWHEALTIVRPATLIRWHRDAFRLLWRCRPHPGCPRLPADLQRLIAAMARSYPTWDEGWIAAELVVKLGIRVAPRTIRRYRPKRTTARMIHLRSGGTSSWGDIPMPCDFFGAALGPSP
jgi:hypothetical protein